MKIVQINAVCGSGSTGKICVDVSKLLTENNIENYILYSSGSSDYPLGIKHTNDKYIKLQALKSRIFGNYGFNSGKATKNLISELERIKPDAVHLHNIHGHNVNLEMLFKYFKKNPQIKLYWTFHDCWAFTAYCPHFTMAGCDFWREGCHNCVQKGHYSWFFDKSKQLYERKKELFSDLNLTIITPSKWLGDLVKQSFLRDYEVKVINNGIDLDVFKPTESDFREKYNLQGKKIVLGVAFGWGERKGLDVFIELSKRLSENYQIVLVGTNDEVDKQLPSSIISIHRTSNQRELAEIYTASDVYANPTREDTFPTVNMEALACGTPVVTFRTGGSPEIIDEKTGIVIENEDINELEKSIIEVCEGDKLTKEACLERAKIYNRSDRYEDYIKLYLAR
ncbi:MAG: glycosyltransferase [Clostridia bacterium]|nr:glycosyltransferase [Clostridia bacterium]